MKISIVTVCYNSERTIQRTIDSILNQNYKDIEYIIVDGKSKDKTLNIIECNKQKLINKGVKLKYISEQDNGIYDAMNKGISLCTGDYVGIINSDDWYEENIIESVAKELQKTKASIIYGNLMIVEKNKSKLRKSKNGSYGIGFHPTVFVSKKIFEIYGQFDLSYKIAADSNFLLKLKKDKIKYHKMDKIIAYFSEGGASEQNKDLGRQEYLRSLKELKMISKIEFVLRRLYYLFLKINNK